MKSLALLLVCGLVAISAQKRCPDGGFCLTKQTCCLMVEGNYGCCPMENAVCCAGVNGCCPEKTTCDIQSGNCVGTGLAIFFKWMVPTYNTEVVEAGLNDHSIHHHLKEVKQEEEEQQNALVDFSEPCEKTQEVEEDENAYVTCPDKSLCLPGSTCCEMKSGDFGCCLYDKATCCSDDIHCCPNEYVCDVKTSSCTLKVPAAVPYPFGYKRISSGFYPSKKPSEAYIFNHVEHRFELKRETKVKPEESSDVDFHVCPDPRVKCKEEWTCCRLAPYGPEHLEYGCCDMPMATCCKDLFSCCPQGYLCNDSVPGGCEKVPSLNLFLEPVYSQKRRLQI